MRRDQQGEHFGGYLNPDRQLSEHLPVGLHVDVRPRTVAKHALHGIGLHLSVWVFLWLIDIGCSLAFLYLRLIGKTSTFPVRDPRLVESLRLRN